VRAGKPLRLARGPVRNLLIRRNQTHLLELKNYVGVRAGANAARKTDLTGGFSMDQPQLVGRADRIPLGTFGGRRYCAFSPPDRPRFAEDKLVTWASTTHRPAGARRP
jgi:hypothetical protein